MIKTTDRHFKVFESECLKWIEYFGLKGWKVYFFHKKIDEDSRAQIRVNIKQRVASILLNKQWDETPILELHIKQSAFHEVCELMFWRLASMAHGEITSNYASINEETHNLIRIMENTVLKMNQ